VSIPCAAAPACSPMVMTGATEVTQGTLWLWLWLTVLRWAPCCSHLSIPMTRSMLLQLLLRADAAAAPTLARCNYQKNLLARLGLQAPRQGAQGWLHGKAVGFRRI